MLIQAEAVSFSCQAQRREPDRGNNVKGERLLALDTGAAPC